MHVAEIKHLDHTTIHKSAWSSIAELKKHSKNDQALQLVQDGLHDSVQDDIHVSSRPTGY